MLCRECMKYQLSARKQQKISMVKRLLSNDLPVYEQIAVLEAEANRKPLQNIYLRGFCGDKYENGSWIKDTNGLKGMCHEAGLDYEAVNRDIVYRTIDRIAQTNRSSNFLKVVQYAVWVSAN